MWMLYILTERSNNTLIIAIYTFEDVSTPITWEHLKDKVNWAIEKIVLLLLIIIGLKYIYMHLF